MTNLFDEPMDFAQVGIGCSHSWEAIQTGVERMKLIAQKGTDAQVEYELQHTDPLVRAFLLVGLQRSMYKQYTSYGSIDMGGHMLGHRFHQITKEQLGENLNWLLEEFEKLADPLEARLGDLHIEPEHVTNSWPYGPLPVFADDAPKAVDLKPEENDAAVNILSQFGNLLEEL
jgi:hypothetical protein